MKTAGKILACAVAASFLSWACGARAEHKPKDEDCLVCHSDPTLTKDVNGKQVSLRVDPDKMKQLDPWQHV